MTERETSDGIGFEFQSDAMTPVVSIVIPIHGKWSSTELCLDSLSELTDTTPFEIIVVDDASKDDSRKKLEARNDVLVIPLNFNVGYLRATNEGAARAQGEWILLLNNDTEILDGSIDALVEAGRSSDRIGAVGAKLLFPDGTLQEAGAIMWSDGTAWNFGRGDDPDRSPYRYRREVDYCSAAALLVRKDLWQELGGFDETFVPAYCEDSDLCFSLRLLGHQVILEPRAVVIHHEGVSHGTSTTGGIKKYQDVNREKFVLKWSTELKTQFPNNFVLAGLARERAPMGRVLYVDHQLPAPLEDSGSYRVFEYMKILRQLGFAVTFLPNNRAYRSDLVAQLSDIGVECYFDFDSREIVERLSPELTLAILNRPEVSWNFLAHIRKYAPQCRIIYDTHDLHFVREQRRLGEAADVQSAMRYLMAVREQETSLIRAADATIVVSPVEMELLRGIEPGAHVVHISNVHEPAWDHTPFASERSGMMFLGGFMHTPNIDAVEWFCDAIHPDILRCEPDALLHVVGGSPTESILALESEDVMIHGWVEDIEPLLRSARLMVAPLRYGAGVKGKIGMALSHGLPVVTTSMGAEGMGLVHGTDVMIADSPSEFAKAVERVMRDDDLWRHLSHNGMQSVAREFGRDVAEMRIRQLLANLNVLDAQELAMVVMGKNPIAKGVSA